jgi:asparagine synthase (glutamine-hydrolysing)
MCGLVGFIKCSEGRRVGHKASDLDLLGRMAYMLAHRGPDDVGTWIDANSGLSFAHRRLSIVDLSNAGHQPMVSASGRYVIVFNGEIYNHLSMRMELDARATHTATLANGERAFEWRGHSDTETLLAGIETWGVEATLKKTVGMFAIALWDTQDKVLTLARDRMGEKPLYYGFQGQLFLFGSELKAIKVHPDFLSEIDRDVICLYLRHSYIPAPHSIYKGIRKLLPGTYLQVDFGADASSTQELIPKNYWSLVDVAERGMSMPFEGSDTEAVLVLDSQLKKAIDLQMMSDVPLGAFLSGGVDSSTVVALMQSQSMRPIKTFSIGFEDANYNEAVYAKAVAQHLGTEHTELYVSSKDAMGVIPLLGKIYDEPFADSSQIPSFLVSKMAKQHVSVSLSGDGGDELFCGYNRYLLVDTWKKIEYLPFEFRKSVGHLMRKIPPTTWNKIFNQLGEIKNFPRNMADKIEKLANHLEKVNGINELYYSLVSEINYPEKIVIGATEPATWLKQVGLKSRFKDPKQGMMLMDAMTYLPDDILVKVDRAAMANSLETRVPFLDHRVVELAWRLPMAMKVRGGQSKWILRKILYQYVPQQLIDRPKAGFGIPLGEWLCGPLRDWAENLLDEQRLRQEGYFNANFVRELWGAHLMGRRNNQSLLWSILMFQEWLANMQTHQK